MSSANSGIATCAIEGLYALICRDPDTAAGGVDPLNTCLHDDGFYRLFSDRLEELEGQGIDRKVEINYGGTNSWYPMVNGVGGKLRRTFTAEVNIGYFMGDHWTESMSVIGDDEQSIAQVVRVQSNYPSCSGGCVLGYVPTGSSVSRIAEDAAVLTISFDVEIYGV